MRSAGRFLAYYGTLAGFGVVAFAFNVVCWIGIRPRGDVQVERRVRRGIHRLFRELARWIAAIGLVKIEYRGFNGPPRPAVMVANHPGLLDAVYFLALLPDALFVFKPAIRHNPLFGPAAVRAGYLASDHQLTLVRAATAKIRDGATFVVFPEGTRTPASGAIGSFKPGFALIARRAGVPVQLVRITVTRGFFTKESGIWKLPTLPVRVTLEAGPCVDPALAPSPAAFVADVEAWFRRPVMVSADEIQASPAAASATTLMPS